MSVKRLITFAIVLQFVFVAIDLIYIDAGFRWIANDNWLWKESNPWVHYVVCYSMLVGTIVGVALFFVCMAWGTNRQRLVSLLPSFFLWAFLIYICILSWKFA